MRGFVQRVGAMTPLSVLSLADAKAHLRVDVSDDDALITNLIGAAVAYVEKITDRSLLNTQHTYTLPQFPRGNCPIVLPRPPLVSLTSIAYTDPDGAAQTIADSRLIPRQPMAELIPAHGTDWPSVRDDDPLAVVVTYQSGYAAGLIPADLRAALLLLIGHMYEHREIAVVGTIIATVPMGFDALVWCYRVWP